MDCFNQFNNSRFQFYLKYFCNIQTKTFLSQTMKVKTKKTLFSNRKRWNKNKKKIKKKKTIQIHLQHEKLVFNLSCPCLAVHKVSHCNNRKWMEWYEWIYSTWQISHSRLLTLSEFSFLIIIDMWLQFLCRRQFTFE